MDPENIEVTVESGALTVTGTRGFDNDEEITGGYHRKEIFEGRFKRTMALPDGTDTDAVTATTKDGILEVLVPKKPEVLARKINVDVPRSPPSLNRCTPARPRHEGGPDFLGLPVAESGSRTPFLHS